MKTLAVAMLLAVGTTFAASAVAAEESEVAKRATVVEKSGAKKPPADKLAVKKRAFKKVCLVSLGGVYKIKRRCPTRRALTCKTACDCIANDPCLKTFQARDAYKYTKANCKECPK